jgi:hypothetical protein
MRNSTLSLKTWKRDPVELFEEHLFAERNRFLIAQAMRGERQSRSTISKTEAERRLKAAVAALDAEGGR